MLPKYGKEDLVMNNCIGGLFDNNGCWIIIAALLVICCCCGNN